MTEAGNPFPNGRLGVGVLMERFPLLQPSKEDPDGFVGHCPIDDSLFDVKQTEAGYRITACFKQHSPQEIWESARIIDQREPGEDREEPPPIAGNGKRQDKSPAFTSFIVRLTEDELLADPKPRIYLLKSAKTGRGILARGQVFLVAARGGSGKSNSVLQLGVAVATGTNWFGAGLGWAAEMGRVLVVCAEENYDEIKRRIHFAIKAADIVSDEQLALIARHLELVPMRGQSVALTGMLEKGVATVTERTMEILDYLKLAKLEGRPFSLVIFDPLTRFAGADVETDNFAGTKFIEVCERFTDDDCGAPDVGITHHVKKISLGGVEGDSIDIVRGSSSIIDGVRWAAVMAKKKGEDKLVRLRVVKTNYGAEPDPLVLGQVDGCEGMLVAVPPPAKAASDNSAEIPRDPGMEKRILNSIEKRGPGSGKQLAERLGVHQRLVNPSLGRLVEDGTLILGAYGKWKYSLPGEPKDEPKHGQVKLL